VERAEIGEKAGKYWDEQLQGLANRTVTPVLWWEDKTTTCHINGIVGNPNATEVHEAFHQRIAQFFEGRINLKAISVRCGAGTKEMWLMQMIDVARFDLYDVAKEVIAFGKEEAARQNVSDRVRLFAEDAFAARVGVDYDLVYWNNALHHMPNVEDALNWSYDRLKPGGLLAINVRLRRPTRAGGRATVNSQTIPGACSRNGKRLDRTATATSPTILQGRVRPAGRWIRGAVGFDRRQPNARRTIALRGGAVPFGL
jgi:SAM-dependent methyltransferase